MELFRNIRHKIGMSTLAKRVSRAKRKVNYSSLSEVNSIGVVWDASKPDDFVHLSKFHQKMHERNIEVKILGYFQGKNLPDQYTAIRFLTCIRTNEINIFYCPVSPEATAFISKKFDILIDINFKNLFPLYYISSLSASALKVGLYRPENSNSPFDLMMNIEKTDDLDNYLGQVIHYLEMINSPTIKTEK